MALKNFLGLSLDNAPLINVRFDFRSTLMHFRNQSFRDQFPGRANGAIRPITTNDYTWHGMPSVLLTHILRQSIVGLESAVSGAVLIEAMDRGVATPSLRVATNDPFALKAGGTAASVFNALPSLIDSDFALNKRYPDLWIKVKKFYKEIRNPIFHSYEISENDPLPVLACLELLWEIYQWLNSWHSIENIAGGMINWSEQTLADPSYIPELSKFAGRRMFPERSLIGTVAENEVNGQITLLKISVVKGVYVGSIDRVDFSLESDTGVPTVVMMAPYEAMRMQYFMKKVQVARGWRELDDCDVR